MDSDEGWTVLATPMQYNNANAATICEYLVALARAVWEEDNASGKRPFGNSGWRYDIYAALGQAGLMEMTFNAEGEIEDFSLKAIQHGDRLIDAALDKLKALGVG